MLDFLKKLVRYKRVDLEAKLKPTPACTFGGVGEVELEVWNDDTAVVEVSIEHSSVPDGSELRVVCSGSELTVLPLSGGYAKQRLTYDEGRPRPRIEAGHEAEFILDGTVLYRGTFRRD